jgi:hypothetical protein
MDRANATLEAFIEGLAGVEAAEQARARRVRDQFEQATGHPRGPALIGADATAWRSLEAADPPDHPVADALAAEAIDRFCAGDAGTRGRLIEAFEPSRYLRWRIGWPTAEAIARIAMGGASGEHSIAGGIAGVVLGFGDPRDAIVALDRLCLDALRAGLEPFDTIGSTAASLTEHAPAVPTLRTLRRYLDPDRQAAFRRSASTSRARDPPRGQRLRSARTNSSVPAARNPTKATIMTAALTGAGVMSGAATPGWRP